MYSVGKRAPLQDDSQDLQFKFKEKGFDKMDVTVRRALDTSDGKDYVLPVDTVFDLAWAVNIQTSKIDIVHNFRGAFQTMIPTISTYKAANDITDD